MRRLRHVAAALLAAVAVLTTAAPPAGAASDVLTQSVDPWFLADRLVEQVDGDWQARRQVYTDRGRLSIRANAMLLEVHALAALAGHTGSARRDERIPGLVRFFTTEPVVVYRNTKKRQTAHFPHTPAWSSVYTANPLTATLHPSADAIIARALAAAWRAREIAALPAAESKAIQEVVGAVARGRFYRAPNRAENQINWNTDIYQAALEVTGDRTRLPDYRAHLKWFIGHAHRKAYKGGSSNLSRGWGFRYLPQKPAARSGANAIDTVEYANLVHSSLGFYDAAVRAGMRPLNRRQVEDLRRWSRSVVYGTWTHAGYLNWDSGLGSARRHLRQYWGFALDSLVRSAGPGSLVGTAARRAQVREIAEQGLALFQRTAWNGTGPLPSSTSFDAPNGFENGSRSGLITTLRFAIVGAALDTNLPTTTAKSFGNVYSHDTEFGRLTVSTPDYNLGIVRPAGQLQGGLEPARLFDSRQRPLTVLTAGAVRGPAPGLRLSRDGATVIDDQPGDQGRAGRIPGISVDGWRRNNAGTFTALSAHGAINRGKARVAVRHRFSRSAIETTYSLTRGNANTVTLRLPVWGRTSTLEFRQGVRSSGRRIVRHGNGRMLVRARTPDGAVMFAAFGGVPRDAQIAIVGYGPSATAPQGARELRIRFRPAKRDRVTRRIAVVADAPLP